MKVVIDSNVFVQCLNPFSRYNSVFQELVKGSYKLYVSTDIAFEYFEVFRQKFQNVKAEAIDRFFNESNHVVRTAVYYKWNLITVDPDDNKFVDCAIAANADYIVTNDKHFNILKEINFPKVSCITIEEFIEILKKH